MDGRTYKIFYRKASLSKRNFFHTHISRAYRNKYRFCGPYIGILATNIHTEKVNIEKQFYSTRLKNTDLFYIFTLYQYLYLEYGTEGVLILELNSLEVHGFPFMTYFRYPPTRLPSFLHLHTFERLYCLIKRRWEKMIDKTCSSKEFNGMERIWSSILDWD